MNDSVVRELARRAGISVEWTDYANHRREVPIEAVRHILGALGLPCDTADELASSRRELDAPVPRPLLTANAGEPIDLRTLGDVTSSHARLIREDGASSEVSLRSMRRGLSLPAVEAPGYYTINVDEKMFVLAVAPDRCITASDIVSNERIWALAAQTYGLRTAGDCGIGDMSGVAALAKSAANLKADALALSPMHALFAADPSQYSPYAPSNRLFYNPLHADASTLFGKARVMAARSLAGIDGIARELETQPLIDWIRSSGAKMATFRRLFEDFLATDLARQRPTDLASDFAHFRKESGQALEDHSIFEAIHSLQLKADPRFWHWNSWPADFRDPRSAVVRRFAEKHQQEITFHSFLQWVTGRSFAAAQRGAKQSGMRIGLIADLAVGMSGAGSLAWSSQKEILHGLEVGAPPDLFNPNGQTWGLTTFSPRALVQGGFAPYLATLRASMRPAGGVRIDHVMGLTRLWVVPNGAKASEGAYLDYPIADLLRLTALESHRSGAIVIGEDLGTVPVGLRERLGRAGIYGMGVLWFERDGDRFIAPAGWPQSAAAMTSTHDLPTVAGWWRGRDIEVRAAYGLSQDIESEGLSRVTDRNALWEAFKTAGAGTGNLPEPGEGQRVADAAVDFVAATPSPLAIIPLEDALALQDQPNLPGTIDQHPNWRRRYPTEAAQLLEAPSVRGRLEPLKTRTKE
jgi:4-alpha-glucanotransferase